MSNTPIKVETDLSTILNRIEGKIDKIDERINRLEIGQTEIKGDIKALDTKVDGMDQRLEKVENSQKAQIWTLIGILGTAVLGIVIRLVITAIPGNP